MPSERVPEEFALHMHEAEADLSEAEVPDIYAKFLQDAELAGVAGGFRTVEKFQAETSRLDQRAKKIYQDRAKAEAGKTAGAKLEKRAAPVGSRVEKSQNGEWELVYDANGELIAGRAISK